MPKINKRKQAKQISDMSISAERKRKIIRDKIFPLLADSNESIKFIKTVISVATITVDQAFNNKRKDMKIGELGILSLLNLEDKRSKIFSDLFTLLADEDINSFQDMLRDLPDNLDRFFINEIESKPFSEVDINKILG